MAVDIAEKEYSILRFLNAITNPTSGKRQQYGTMQKHRLSRLAASLSLCVLTACGSAPPPRPALRPLVFHAVPEAAAPLDTNPRDLALLNRVTWGGSTASAQALQSMGLEAYLAGQINPPVDDGMPPDAQAQIDSMEISRKSVVQITAEIAAARKHLQALKGKPAYDDAQKALQQKLNGYAREAATRSLLRDLYSKNQLKEQLTWFWMNHFNVSQSKGDIRALVGDYEENAIRQHALGKFRELLVATVLHPAMLQYLDNAQNAVGHINENYAREIMELHTLGVGSGYSQRDVQELARILTGLGVNLSGSATAKGRRPHDDAVRLVQFAPKRHDFGTKVFLGTTIKGQGLREVAEAVAILSLQPPTARFISKELAKYFCCDEPPPALVDAMTRSFRASDGNIAAVLKAMLAAPEFQASLGQKFKDPIHYAVSALRVSYGEAVVINSAPMFNWLNRMGEPLYGHETPDGYSMNAAAWSGPGQMETRFEIARAIGLGRSGLFKLPDDKAPEPAPPPNIQQIRYYDAVAPTLNPATKAALAQVEAPSDWNLLFLSSPEFMHR